MNPGEPYPGPPSAPPPYGAPVYGQPAYGPPVYGSPEYAPPPYWGPPPPRRPGQVTGAAVLSFVQAGLVLCATLYIWLLVSMGRLAAVAIHGPSDGGPLVAEGTVLAIVQLLSVAALVAAGVLALGRRSRLAWVVVLMASAAQAALAGYWATRLPALIGDFDSGTTGNGVAVFAVAFAVAPLVALGLVLVPPGRGWFDGTPHR